MMLTSLVGESSFNDCAITTHAKKYCRQNRNVYTVEILGRKPTTSGPMLPQRSWRELQVKLPLDH